MNDFEMMNQRVDQLREELARLSYKRDCTQVLIDDVMVELLDTRRQITREEVYRNNIRHIPVELAPVDYLDV